MLKDWMSPEIWSKYSTSNQQATQSSNNDGEHAMDKTTATTVDDEGTHTVAVNAEDDTPAKDQPTEDKPIENE